jgi:antitoxin component YwqK of YwqJK toxin-antitoxin module
MKITSPWQPFALLFYLAAGACWLPLSAVESQVPVPERALDPIVSAVEPVATKPTAAEIPAAAPAPLQPVESVLSLVAPPGTSSRLSKVRITDAKTIDKPKQDASVEAKASDVVTELLKEHFPSGAIKIEREVARDRDGIVVLHGVFRQFDERGALLCEGTHEDGQPVGVWKRYYAANQAPLFATSPYKEFAGPFTSEASFSEGQIDGKWTITDAKQRKVSEIDFVGGQRHGRAVWYYPTGTLHLQTTFDHGRVHGDVMKWDQNASLLGKELYTYGCKLALKEEYDDAAHKRSEVMYLQAPLIVKTADNFHAATLATFEQRGQDEKFGTFRMWHTNGQLSREGEYRYNLRVGKATWFYSNGQKKMEGTYLDGKQEGSWTWWHQNGMKQIAGDYRDGVAIGKWQWWKEDGKLAKTSNLSVAKIADIPSSFPDNEEGSIRR